MKYKVQAVFDDDKLPALYDALTDGTIENQKPDGMEIVESMRRAKITAPGVVQWCETCFCNTPLEHERATVYDKFFTDIATEPVNQFGEIEGEPFWAYLERAAEGEG